jgi:hypothetical protein
MSRQLRKTLDAVIIAIAMLVAVGALAAACGSLDLPTEQADEQQLQSAPKPVLRAIGEVSASGELLWSTGALTVTRTERLMPGAYAIYVEGLTAHTTIQAIPRGAPAMTLSVVDDGYGLAQGYIGVAFSIGTTPVDRAFYFELAR